MILRSRITLRLSPGSTDKLDVLSRASGRTRNELVHDAVEQFIDGPNATTASLSRIAQATEFMQIALDLMVKRDMPDERQPIMLAVAKRMEQFHGAR